MCVLYLYTHLFIYIHLNDPNHLGLTLVSLPDRKKPFSTFQTSPDENNLIIMLLTSAIIIILTIQGAFGVSKHPCDRMCKVGLQPMECHFTFTVESYSTLSKACFNCPQNQTDCDREDCISGDGVKKSIIAINRCNRPDVINKSCN